MMKSAVTICLVPEAKQGPFVFHCDPTAAGLQESCRIAAELGFHGVEVFPESAEAFPREHLMRSLATHHLSLAAVGTGAGWVKHKLHMCHADSQLRSQARAFIAGIIDRAGEFGAPAIVGSMQGRFEGNISRDTGLNILADALASLGDHASRHGQVLLYEPLNRYETNLFTQQAEAATFLQSRDCGNVRLLCDLFHMNIEEADSARAILDAGSLVGHIHWADSNRWAMGRGQTNPNPIIAALSSIGYDGYLSAEIFPRPTATEAARQSAESMHRFFSQ